MEDFFFSVCFQNNGVRRLGIVCCPKGLSGGVVKIYPAPFIADFVCRLGFVYAADAVRFAGYAPSFPFVAGSFFEGNKFFRRCDFYVGKRQNRPADGVGCISFIEIFFVIVFGFFRQALS